MIPKRVLLAIAGLLCATTAMCAQQTPSNASNSRPEKLAEASSSPLELIQKARKLIVVTTSDWNSVSGKLTRYERTNRRWRRVSEPTEIVVGKNGLAWDPLLAPKFSAKLRGSTKREGDGRAPAGVFTIGRSFGYERANSDEVQKLKNYFPLTPSLECVDDPNSKHYAQIVDRLTVPKVDWKSSEQMRRPDDLYEWGIVVNYNTDATVPAAGSCIFLHVWRGSQEGTAGCTAMPKPEMRSLIEWLDPEANAAIVQLPEAAYQQLRSKWSLP